MIPKHELFYFKYIQTGRNATREYIAAGYKCSANTAKANAARLLKRLDIQKFIEEISIDKLKNEQINAKAILNELGKIAFNSTHSFVNDDGTLKQFHDLSPDSIAALDTYDLKYLDDGSYKFSINFKDKLKALYLLARYFGLFDRNRAKLENNFTVTIQKLYEPNECNKNYYENTEKNLLHKC